jgi:drug/metabolite transporter (DMT)-like permease
LNITNSRFWVVIIIGLLILNLSSIRAQEWYENDKYGWEFLGAIAGDVLIGIPIAVAVSYANGSLDEVAHDVGPAFVFVLTAYIGGGSIGAPLGTLHTGKIVHDKGSVLGSFIGGVVGTTLGGLVTVYLIDKSPQEVVIPTILLLPPLCSVIGYNLFPHKSDSQSHLSPKNFPELSLTIQPEKHDNKISPKIGAKVTVRF